MGWDALQCSEDPRLAASFSRRLFLRTLLGTLSAGRRVLPRLSLGLIFVVLHEGSVPHVDARTARQEPVWPRCVSHYNREDRNTIEAILSG